MIEWKKTRKNGVIATGTKKVGDNEITWNIKKSSGGMSYQLFLGEPTGIPTFDYKWNFISQSGTKVAEIFMLDYLCDTI